jgi:REP element-mobilizing transposase RayT
MNTRNNPDRSADFHQDRSAGFQPARDVGLRRELTPASDNLSIGFQPADTAFSSSAIEDESRERIPVRKRATSEQRRPHHADFELQPYFVSTRVRDSQPRLVADVARHAVQELFAQKMLYGFLVLAFVFMPDHAHFVIVPARGYSIGQTMRAIKGAIARRVNVATAGSGAFWQSGFFDKNPRDIEALNRFVEYTESNPVRAHLTLVAADYAYSSADGSCVGDYHAFLELEQT